jgi:hypothetical protein
MTTSVFAQLKPTIVHLCASTDLLASSAVRQLKNRHGTLRVMRSIPVVDDESIAIAESYDGIAESDNKGATAGVDSKTKTDKADGSHTKDLRKVKQFVDRAKSLLR